MQSVRGSVRAVELAKDHFQLTEHFNEPVINFDSWALRAKSREVCPDGYIYESRQALKTAGFGSTHSACLDGANCTYALEWRIKCADVPYEPFSIFGKTE